MKNQHESPSTLNSGHVTARKYLRSGDIQNALHTMYANLLDEKMIQTLPSVSDTQKFQTLIGLWNDRRDMISVDELSKEMGNFPHNIPVLSLIYTLVNREKWAKLAQKSFEDAKITHQHLSVTEDEKRQLIALAETWLSKRSRSQITVHDMQQAMDWLSNPTILPVLGSMMILLNSGRY